MYAIEITRRVRQQAAAAYLWILVIPIFFFYGRHPFIRAHAKQALMLLVLSVLGYFIPILVVKILFMGLIGASMILGFVRAIKGQDFVLPFLGEELRQGKYLRPFFLALEGRKKKENQNTEASGYFDEEIEVNLPTREEDIAFISYIPVVSLWVLRRRTDHPFILFHARQGAMLTLLLPLAFLMPPLSYYIVGGGGILLMLLGMLMVLERRAFRVPLLFWLSEKLKTVDHAWLYTKTLGKWSAGVIARLGKKASPISFKEQLLLEKESYTTMTAYHENLFASTEVTDDRRILYALAYVIGPIMLAGKKEQLMVFHAKQGTILLILLLLGALLHWTTFTAYIILFLLYGAEEGWRGRKYPLPLIGELMLLSATYLAKIKTHHGKATDRPQ